jgi:hypothetical protein
MGHKTKMKDQELGDTLLAQVKELRRSIDAVGPSLLRHVLDHLLTEAYKALINFDQEKYDTESEETFCGLERPSFIAFHETETGYKSAKEAQDWINSRENPEEYYVKQCFGETPNGAFDITEYWETVSTKGKIDAAVKEERRRISRVLGLI